MLLINLKKNLPTVKLLERVISSTTNHAYMLNGKRGGKMETESPPRKRE